MTNAKLQWQWPSLHDVDDADRTLLLSALHQENWSNGDRVKEFERLFADYCGSKHALLVVNCTAAIRLALVASDIGLGDEVIVPGLTWPSVPLAVIECGAHPVAVDVEARTYSLDLDAVRAATTSRTRAIIPTHLFCSQVDMPPLMEFADSKGIVVIEDAAHVVGARRSGAFLGTLGHAGCFSFNQKKLLSCGEGGCLITDDTELYRRARRLREIDGDAVESSRGLPGTLMVSEFSAALLISQLRKLDAGLRVIQQNADVLRRLVESIDGVTVLDTRPDTNLQTYYGFCMRISNIADIRGLRRELQEELNTPVSGAYVPLNRLPVPDAGDEIRARAQMLYRHLPVSERAHYGEAVRLRHNVLKAKPEDLEEAAHIVATTIARWR